MTWGQTPNADKRRPCGSRRYSGSDPKPRLAITCGDPAGIGPEVVAKALASPRLWRWCRPLVIGDERLWQRHRCRAPALGPSTLRRSLSRSQLRASGLGTGPSLFHVPVADWRSFKLGRPQPNAGRAALAWVELAVELALAGHVAGIVTAPVSKAAITSVGIPFRGLTEWLAHRTGTRSVAMLLVGGEGARTGSPGRGQIRTALVTRHIPLADVPQALTRRRVIETARLFYQTLQTGFGLRAPRVVACALNPHGGEGGLFGREERRVILPALRNLRRERVPLTGPLPADTAFRQAAEGQVDGILALYHDQAMIALKLHAPRTLVNVTAGLPFIRTAPGHGTAYDIAGQGKADPTAFLEAIRLAAQLASRHQRPGDVGR